MDLVLIVCQAIIDILFPCCSRMLIVSWSWCFICCYFGHLIAVLVCSPIDFHSLKNICAQPTWILLFAEGTSGNHGFECYSQHRQRQHCVGDQDRIEPRKRYWLEVQWPSKEGWLVWSAVERNIRWVPVPACSVAPCWCIYGCLKLDLLIAIWLRLSLNEIIRAFRSFLSTDKLLFHFNLSL